MLKTFCTVLTAVQHCGCASTRSTITEFDKDGKITKVTESTQSVIQTLMSSTQNKSVIIWEDGWAAYIFPAVPAPLTIPRPTVRSSAVK